MKSLYVYGPLVTTSRINDIIHQSKQMFKNFKISLTSQRESLHGTSLIGNKTNFEIQYLIQFKKGARTLLC